MTQVYNTAEIDSNKQILNSGSAQLRPARQPWTYIFIGREAETLWGTKYALERTRVDIPESCLKEYGMDFAALVKDQQSHGYRLYAMEKLGQNG